MGFDHELVIPNEDFPFRLFLFEGMDGNYRREKHWHRSIEIFAVCEGELAFHMDGKTYPLKSGEFIIVNSNEVHSIDAPQKNMTIVLQIPLKAFEKYSSDDQVILFHHFFAVKDTYFLKLLQEMYFAYEEKKRGYYVKVLGLFYMVMHHMITTYQTTDISEEILRRNKNLDKLSRITNYIKENHENELSLEQVANVFGYSPTYLSRMFRNYAGISYKTYLDHLRLQYAVKDMEMTNDSLSTIAYRHGFSNSKALARAFQKKYGILPSAYIKNKKDKKSP